MSLDFFLDKTWSESYTCFDFACDVFNHVNNTNITKQSLVERNELKEIHNIEDKCFALLSNNIGVDHVGVIINGKIIHLAPTGAQMVSLDILRLHFRSVRFFK